MIKNIHGKKPLLKKETWFLLTCLLSAPTFGLPAGPVDQQELGAINKGDAAAQSKKSFKPNFVRSTKAQSSSFSAGVSKVSSSSDSVDQAISELADRLRQKNKTAASFTASADSSGVGYSSKQIEALKAIRDMQSMKSLNINFRQDNLTPSFISGLNLELRSNSSVKQSLSGTVGASVSTGSEVLSQLNSIKEVLRLANPEQELQQTSENTDDYGRSHIRYQQLHQGIPIFGRELIAHVNANKVYAINGHIEPSEAEYGFNSAAQIATLEPKQAVDIALQEMQWDPSRKFEVTAEPTLTYYRDHESKLGVAPLRLAYDLAVMTFLDYHWQFIVDAETGEILKKYSLVVQEMVNGSGVDLLGVQQNFSVWHEPTSQTHYMADHTIPSETLGTTQPFTEGFQERGDLFILDMKNGTKDSDLRHVINITPNNSGGNTWDATAVSAYANTLQSYSYFKDTFNRKSFDDKDGNLIAVVHYDKNLDNAFWNGKAMFYGDGGNDFEPLAKCLDVAAHEYSHGVIGTSAKLVYENQSGALNESFADVFAVMVDREDFLLGEDCTRAQPGFLRNLLNPHEGLGGQPKHMNEYRNMPNTPETDHGGVHINSGIPNYAAYLVIEGLTKDGLGTSIGFEATEHIYYQALTNYLTATSVFVDARRALILAAKDYCQQRNITNCIHETAIKTAYDAVGIVDEAAGEPQPQPDVPAPKADPVSGDDFMAYIYPIGGENHLYLYHFNEGFTGFDHADDYPVDESGNALAKRATMVTTEGTTELFYLTNSGIASRSFATVDEINDKPDFIQVADLNNLAISPAGNKIAFVLLSADPELVGYPEKYITVFDVDTGESTDIIIPSIDYRPDTENKAGRSEVIAVDAITFNYKGTLLAFDALFCVPEVGKECDQNGNLYWTLGIINLSTGATYYPFTDQSHLIDIGYPSFANTNDFILAFDYVDRSQGDFHTFTYVLDVEQGIASPVIDHGESNEMHLSVPAFWGDDKYLVYVGDSINGLSTFRLPMDNWKPLANANSESINNAAANLPFMHRAGERSLSSGLSVNAASLNFGDIAQGAESSLTVTLTNSSTHAIDLQEITIPKAAGFRHTAFNRTIEKQTSYSFNVVPYTNNPGVLAGNLTIKSDEGQELTVALSANVVAGGGNPGDQNPGDQNPGNENPGNENPGNQNPSETPDRQQEDEGSDNDNSGGGGGGAAYALWMLGLSLMSRRFMPVIRQS